MTNETSRNQRTKVGVILVHGIGEAKPGEVVSQTVLGLRDHVDIEPYREMRELLDDGEERRISGDRKSVDLSSKWQMHKQRGRVDDGLEFVVSEAYWSDLKQESRAGLPAILRLFSVILNSNGVISGVSRGRLYWTAYPVVWICQLISWLLRGPILGMNIVLAIVFLSLLATEYWHLISKAFGTLSAAPAAVSFANPAASGAAHAAGRTDALWAHPIFELSATLVACLALGVWILLRSRRRDSFWRRTGLWILIATVVFSASYVLTNAFEGFGSILAGGATASGPGAVGRSEVARHFFFIGMLSLSAVWGLSILMAVAALVVALLHFLLYPLSSFARSVYRRLFLAFSVMAIQAVAWAIVTRPFGCWTLITSRKCSKTDLRPTPRWTTARRRRSPLSHCWPGR